MPKTSTSRWPIQRAQHFLVAILILLASGGVVSGCDDSQDFVASNPGAGRQADDGFFMGRVLLEDFAAGDQVVISDLNGNQLFSLTTANNGVFYSYGMLPQDFRITAVRANGVVHSREVRGGYDGNTMYVNPLTTLASRLMQATPGLSLADAEERVRARFSVPPGFPFDWITNSEASPFRPAVFLAEATQNGGVEAYYEAITEQLQAAVAGQSVSESLSQAGSDLVTTIAGNLLGDTVSVIDSGAFGAVTQFFGLNLGTTGAINAVSMQLDQVLTDLQSLEGSLNVTSIEGQYNMDLGFLMDSINNAKNFSNAIIDAAANGDTSGLTFSTLLQAENDIDTVQNYLVGTQADNIIFTYAQYLLNAKNLMNLSSSDLALYQSYPVRVNSNTANLQQNLGLYLGSLSLLLNNRAELAHASVSPADQLDAALVDFQEASGVAFQANAQVPPPLASDKILLDMERGEMWSLYFQPEANYYDAQNIADGWQEGGYDDWGLSSRDAIDGFAQTRIGNAKTTDDNDGWETGFNRFGFDTTNYGKQKYQGGTGIGGNTNVQGQTFYDINTNSGDFSSNDVYQWSGVNFLPATAYYPPTVGETDFLSTYLIQRVYASPNDEGQRLYGDPFAYATLPSSGSLSVTVSGNQLSAKTPLDAKGVTTPAVDVTKRTFWTATGSNASTATVSNSTGTMLNSIGPDLGPSGQITWHPPINGDALTPVTFEGKLWGPTYGGGGGQGPQAVASMTGSIVVTPPSGLKPNATSLQVVPFDFALSTMTNEVDLSSQGPTQAYRFDVYGTTFYQDGQFHDVTSAAGISYAFLDPKGNVLASQAAGGGFIDSDPSRLLLYKALPAGTYTIRLQYTTPAPYNQALTGTIPLIVNNVVDP